MRRFASHERCGEARARRTSRANPALSGSLRSAPGPLNCWRPLDGPPSADDPPGDHDHGKDQEYPGNTAEGFDDSSHPQQGDEQEQDSNDQYGVHGPLQVRWVEISHFAPRTIATCMPESPDRRCGYALWTAIFAAMSNERISRIPPGSRDLLSSDVRRRRQVQSTWFDLSCDRGYEEVIPPTFEYEEVFTLGAGKDLAARLIRFIDQDGRLVALRADFTASIARMVATRLATAPRPLRLCYAGKVYRQAAQSGGHHRELFQLGAELIGAGEPADDVEAIRLVLDTLKALRIEDFQINLGEIRFIQPLLNDLGEAEAELARAAIDRKDRATLRRIAESSALDSSRAAALQALPELVGRAGILDRAAELASTESARAAIDRLRTIDSLLSQEERARIVYDLGEIRGLGYYTGIRFEVFVAGVGRAVGSGGRYDNLLALYGLDVPAVGFALETDALADLLVLPEV